MKKLILFSMFGFIFSLSGQAQQKSIVLIPKVGVGFADGTSCLAIGSDVGYQFSKNRISVGLLIGSKKRQEYSNGNFKDLLIGNATLKYSRIFKKGSIAIVPDLGLGFVTSKWTKHSDGTGEYIQSGFGLSFGCGIEYFPMDHLLLKLSYDQA